MDFSEGRRGVFASASQRFGARGFLRVLAGSCGFLQVLAGAIRAGYASALLRGAAVPFFLLRFFLSRRCPPAFLCGVLGDEPLVERLFVHHPEQSPLQEFPDPFAGASPQIELEQERSDEREIELHGHSPGAFGQPVPEGPELAASPEPAEWADGAAPHQAFDPPEEVFDLPAAGPEPVEGRFL